MYSSRRKTDGRGRRSKKGEGRWGDESEQEKKAGGRVKCLHMSGGLVPSGPFSACAHTGNEMGSN